MKRMLLVFLLFPENALLGFDLIMCFGAPDLIGSDAFLSLKHNISLTSGNNQTLLTTEPRL